MCCWTYSLPIQQLPISFLPISSMLSLNLYNGSPIFWRTSSGCLLSIPAFFCRAVAWCHHKFALLPLLRFFQSCHLNPCFSSFLLQSLSGDHPLHAFRHLPKPSYFSNQPCHLRISLAFVKTQAPPSSLPRSWYSLNRWTVSSCYSLHKSDACWLEVYLSVQFHVQPIRSIIMLYVMYSGILLYILRI